MAVEVDPFAPETGYSRVAWRANRSALDDRGGRVYAVVTLRPIGEGQTQVNSRVLGNEKLVVVVRE